MFLMALWYLFSAFNLFANKYIISYLKGDPALLGNLKIFPKTFHQISTFCILWFSHESNVYVHATWFHPATILLWPFCQ